MSAAEQTGQEIAQRTPAELLVARVREDRFKEQIATVLPPTVTVAKFIRVTTTALLADPDIAKLETNSVLRALVQAATAGLMPDNKEAAIVGRGGKAVFQPMIGGFRKIAAEYGWTLKTKAVYEGDFFEHIEEPKEDVKHTPVRPGPGRGELIGAYAKAIHNDGRVLYRVMYTEDIDKRRAQATTQAIWNKWPAEMFEKTVGRDLFMNLPLAESDLERERIKHVLVVPDEPGAAQEMLYGPVRELPAASAQESAPAAPVGGLAVGADETNGSAPEPELPAAGADLSDEPSLDDEDAHNTAQHDAEIRAAADLASQFHPPNGAHRNLSLSEILAMGEKGERWLGWALGKGETLEPAAYRNAVWSFARVYAPEAFQEALAKIEAGATS
jgi:recombination protein RecT